jgi:DNA-binding XRE family transcriptional regulator
VYRDNNRTKCLHPLLPQSLGLSAMEGGVSEERLGLELRRIREERGLAVEELAEKSGVSATTIRDVERGAREARGDTVAKLAKPLGLTFDEVWELQRRRT